MLHHDVIVNDVKVGMTGDYKEIKKIIFIVTHFVRTTSAEIQLMLKNEMLRNSSDLNEDNDSAVLEGSGGLLQRRGREASRVVVN